MQGKFFFILLTIVTVGLVNISAQETPKPPAPKIFSGGVLNGKAKSLAKPAYPAAAKAVNASGAVNVQVTIDENGDVVLASAVSGHPLLRQASEQAALASKFAPTTLSGQMVRVTGVIVYNFVSPMTFTQIGYELALAEKSKSIGSYNANSIARSFPATWKDEKDILIRLSSPTTDKAAESAIPKTSKPTETGEKSVSSIRTYSGNIRTSPGGMANTENPLDADSLESLKQLQSKIETQLSVNNEMLWSFRLGKILGNLKAEINDEAKTQANIAELNQMSRNNPSGISESVLTKINEIVELSRQPSSDKSNLIDLIQNLRLIKGY